MTLALGRRFIIVDGVERWKDKDLDPLEAALEAIAPDTTVAFFAREDSRNRAPDRLRAIVQAADGDISAENSVKPWELPKWVIAPPRSMGSSSMPDAARALIRHVGERQQRLLRELEKLAAAADTDERLTLDAVQVQELTAPSAERKAWAVADALVAGDRQSAVRAYLALRDQGERLPGLLYWISQRLRLAHEVAAAVEAGAAAGTDQAPPADALARGRSADRRCAPGGRRPAAAGDLRDRRPRARVARGRRMAGPARTPRR